MSAPQVYSSINAVAAKLGAEGISKDRKNQQQGFNYRGIEDVYAALSVALAEYQLVIIPRVISRTCVEREAKNGGALFNVTVHTEFDVVSATDGSRHMASTFGEAMDSADKATNKAMSVAYKMMAFQLFCIPVEGQDMDPDATTHEVRSGKGQPPAPPAPPRIRVSVEDWTAVVDSVTNAEEWKGAKAECFANCTNLEDPEAWATLKDLLAKKAKSLKLTKEQVNAK
jgi:hypothetical protein